MRYTSAQLSQENAMEKVLWNIGMEDSMRDFGSKTFETAKVSNGIRTATPILVSLNLEKHMEKVFIPGEMGRFMMVSGIKA